MGERVAVFLPSLRGGGAERAALTVVNELAARGFAVDLLLAEATGAYRDRVAPAVRVLDLGVRRVGAALPRLVSYLRRERPRVALATLTHANLVLLAARRLARAETRVVVREGNTVSAAAAASRRLRERVIPAWVRRLYPRADLVLANSEGVAADLVAGLGVPAARVRVVPNPVEVASVRRAAAEPPAISLPGPGGPPLVVAAGRLVSQKGFGTLIRAFDGLRRRRPAHLAILGEGAERPALEALVRELGLEEHVDLPGFLANPHPVVAAASVFVLSSTWEGLPNVLIEALALGVPVVATDCPSGPREILDGGRFGRLAPVGDEGALAAAIEAALAAPPDREALRQRAEVYDVDRVMPQILAALGLDQQGQGPRLSEGGWIPAGAGMTRVPVARANPSFPRQPESTLRSDSATPLRICYLITGLGIGGAERELTQLARGFAGRGHHVSVVSLLPLTGFATELEEASVPASSLGMRRGMPSLAGLWKLRSLLRARRPQVLHSFMVHANLMARVVRPLAPIPVVISTAQNTFEGGRHRERLLRWTARWADLTTQVSHAGFERYRERRLAPPERLELVPNSVDVESFAPDPAARAAVRAELGAGDRLVFLAVGRLEPQKDYPTLLAGFALAAREAPGAVLWIAGRGPHQAALEAEARRLEIADRVSFLGLRRDITRVLNGADAYVLTSRWEGTPLALLEAQATGLPAVATEVGGNAEVVAPGLSGLLVPPASPAALAAALLTLARLPAGERRAMGESGRRRVAELYGLPATLVRWEAIYRRLLGPRAFLPAPGP